MHYFTALLAAAALAIAGCGSTCIEGRSEACACGPSSAPVGIRTCGPAGEFGGCVCPDGMDPVDAGAPEGDDGGPPMTEDAGAEEGCGDIDVICSGCEGYSAGASLIVEEYCAGLGDYSCETVERSMEYMCTDPDCESLAELCRNADCGGYCDGAFRGPLAHPDCGQLLEELQGACL